MKSKVFSIRFFNYPKHRTVVFYRTNGRLDGGGVNFYDLTVSRLIPLLRAICNTADRVHCYVTQDGAMSTWTIAGVVADMYAAQATLAAEQTHG